MVHNATVGRNDRFSTLANAFSIIERDVVLNPIVSKVL